MPRQLPTIALLLIAFSTLIISSSTCTCKDDERNALLDFKASLLDKSNRLASWVGKDCCNDWEGVKCCNITCNIITIDLRADGRSPLEASEVSSALSELKHLQHLDLSGNNFGGSQIPQFLGLLTELYYLNLSQAGFSGGTPYQLGNLRGLGVLDLSFNNYNGEEMGLSKWIFHLPNLHYLDLSGVNTLSHAEVSSVIFELPSLRTLRLSNCQLTNTHLTKKLVSVSNSSSISHKSTDSSLQTLDLSYNSLTNPIPHVLANLSSISYLDLSTNNFDSLIPSWLASQRNLQRLYLRANQFTGFEGGIKNFINRLCALTDLDLSINSMVDLGGDQSRHENFSNASICNNKYSLKKLDISFNEIIDPLPDWLGNFTTLRHLDLRFNHVSGGIPASIGRLSSLQNLLLSYNNLTGTISKALGGLSSLQIFNLYGNRLVGKLKKDHFSNLSSLNYFDLTGSISLTLELPLDWPAPFQLQVLRMSSRVTNSVVPQWLLSQNQLHRLALSNGGILGTFLDNHINFETTWSSLQVLVLRNNHIQGPLPSSLCGLDLKILDLRSNRLSGTIPDCLGHISSLSVIDLSSNALSGPIPRSLSENTVLTVMCVNNNSLEGELASLEKKNSTTSFQMLDLGDNQLSGMIPSSWTSEKFPNLYMLRLRSNRLNGEIPSQLCSLNQLKIMDLAKNGLAGPIPECLGNLNGMREPAYQIPLSDYEVTLEVIKGHRLDYTSNLYLLNELDLSSNALVGQIPVQIMNLFTLDVLNLSYNHLVGPIPTLIGQLTSLESLDLSNNHLSGVIPRGLSQLNFLAHLNLSYNNFHGSLPTGAQMQTLNDPSIYLGNPDLCGDMLPTKCTIGGGNEMDPTGIGDKGWQKNVGLYISILLGTAAGFWGVIGILMAKKNWR